MPSLFGSKLNQGENRSSEGKSDILLDHRRRLPWTDRNLLRRTGTKRGATSEIGTARSYPTLSDPATVGNTQILPTELIDIIIDHLHDDKKTLAACSLTCHSWLRSSRYHLFYTIIVVADQRLAFWSFFWFLKKAVEIGAYIKELSLWGQSVENDYEWEPLDNHPAMCYHTLSGIVAQVPHLFILRIRGVRFAHVSCQPGRWARSTKLLGKLIRSKDSSMKTEDLNLPSCDSQGYTLPPQRRDLHKLELWQAGDPAYSIADFLHMLALFSVANLIMLDVFVDDLSYDKAPSELFDSALSPHFCVQVAAVLWSSPRLLSILCRSPSINSLSTLNVACDTWEDIRSLGILLLNIRATLQHFILDHGCLVARLGTIAASDWSILSLKSCTKLETIRLKIRMDYIPTLDSTLHTQICTSTLDILSYIPPSVTDVIFRAIVHTPSLTIDQFSNIIDWARMDEILLAQPHLSKVRFTWTERPGPSHMTALVMVDENIVSLKSRLPRVYEKLALRDVEPEDVEDM